jgi:hypothetical protein
VIRIQESSAGRRLPVSCRAIRFLPLLFALLFVPASGSLHAAPAPGHDQFRVAVYIPVFVVQKMKDPAYLQKSWDDLSSQVKVDKVYIETYRSGTIADDANLEQVKSFFAAHNVETAGGIAYGARGYCWRRRAG